MNKTTNHPYNNLFVKMMAIPPHVQMVIEHLSKDLKGKIKPNSYRFATETFVDATLKPHLPDVIYEVEYENSTALLFLLFEHKSYPENIKIQTGRYIFNGLHQQKVIWQQANAQRKAEDKPLLKNFKQQLILPIIFYHGQEKWTDRPFSELFDLPDKSFIKYIPDFEYILIDLSKFTDEYLEKIGDDVLTALLLLLKHKGEKDFIKQHSKKIFKFVEDNPDSEKTKEFLKTIVTFIYQTYHLSQEDVIEIAAELPTKAKANMENTWDTLIEKGIQKGIQIGEARGEARGEAKGEARGEIKGIKIGEAKGEAKGKKETEIKKDLEFTLNLLKKTPNWTNEEVANIATVKPDYVKQVRAAFHKTDEKEIKTFIRTLYKDFPDLTEEKWLEIENWGITLWKKFHEKPVKNKKDDKV